MQATKQEVLEVYKELAKFLPKNSIIAGGCPRDLYFGKPYRDVDIFANTLSINGKTKYFNYSKFIEYEIPKNFGIDVSKTKFFKPELSYSEEDFDTGQGALNSIDCVIDVTINDTKYQIVFVRTPSISNYINDCFDFNFNQIVLDGSGFTLLNGFNNFLTSGKKAEFTPNEAERSKHMTAHHISRVDRFSKKYPEFDFTKLLADLKETINRESVPLIKKSNKFPGGITTTHNIYYANTTAGFATNGAGPGDFGSVIEAAFWLVNGDIYYQRFTDGMRTYKNYGELASAVLLANGTSVSIYPGAIYNTNIDPHPSMIP